MPRINRIVVPGEPHHITQRGNNHQDVFFSDDNRRVYLNLLKEQAGKYSLIIHGYCLMTNHVHIIATPKTEESLAKVIGRTHYLYSLYINHLHKRSGHLWQNRFYSCVLDEAHFIYALCYTERNPVMAKITHTPWEYHWSSAAIHCGMDNETSLLDLSLWKNTASFGSWKKLLSAPEKDTIKDALLLNTRIGRPLASDTFINRLERKLGRTFRHKSVGRPIKNVKR
jgi:REP-associated tyrosine transposase